MDWGDVLQLVGVLVIAGSGLAGSIAATRSLRRSNAAAQATANRAQSSTESNAERDQVQEDLQNLRAEFERHVQRTNAREEKDDRRIRWQESVMRHLDDEVNELRGQMIAAGLTPPSRRPWPRFDES